MIKVASISEPHLTSNLFTSSCSSNTSRYLNMDLLKEYKKLGISLAG